MRNRFKKRAITPPTDPNRIGNNAYRRMMASTKKQRELEEKKVNKLTSFEKAELHQKRVERKIEKHKIKICSKIPSTE